MKRLFCVALIAALSTPAFAQDATPPGALTPEGSQIDWSFFWDGGAVPFLWAPMLGRLALDRYVHPDDEPLGFSASEGGAPPSSWEVPGWSITAAGLGAGFAFLASGDASRWYHAKGIGESLMTGALLTGVLKKTFSRHRPDWSPELDSESERMSFSSGHATQAFAVGTYAILFLRRHVFDKSRGDRLLPWYEALTYGGIALASTTLAAERVYHNRHHVSDVLVGSALGVTSSALFFWYQESRFHAKKEQTTISVVPSITSTGATVGVGWQF